MLSGKYFYVFSISTDGEGTKQFRIQWWGKPKWGICAQVRGEGGGTLVDYLGCLLDENMSDEAMAKKVLKKITKNEILYRQSRYLS